MKNNRQAPTSDMMIMKRAFWIVAIFICIWFSGCTHNVPELPEGYTLICNQFGEYTIKNNNWQSANEFDTKNEAIRWAITWERITNSPRLKEPDYIWSECEGE